MTNSSPRKRNIYRPETKESFRLSQTRIDLFLECPRCFYLDRRLGIDRPGMPGWALNSAVDKLLKNEFDLLREKKESHKLMKKYNIDAVPFQHPDLPVWRDDFYKYVGASVLHEKTNLEICGIIDDVWINKKNEMLIVDYKSTSTSKEISLEDEYKQGYKKQMEIYQWIFRKKGFEVSDTGYFVFANASKNKPKFDGRLEFDLSIIPHIGNDAWVEPTLIDIKKCLDSNIIPDSNPDCEHCNYRELANKKIKQKI
ncbi:MAG: PD-(D/E)XK nuclease family protein [Candidatus Staskawiczbacteria bacterium]|nr:PD-(D/E)XK nuclease family protein [Candidatus Staskawiczbacteria bacterium]